MRSHRFSPAPFLTILILVFCAAPSPAQTVRTFVSGAGLDTNPCSRLQPCRNFAAAIAAVSPGGEVVVQDSAGYGPVTITKSVTLVAPRGIHAAIAPTTQPAIVVSAMDTDQVVVRGLYLNAQGAGDGIALASADSVHLENLVISGFSIRGIQAAPTNPMKLFVVNTVVRNGGGNGIELSGFDEPDGPMFASLLNVRSENNVSVGLLVLPFAQVSAFQMIAAGNETGFLAVGDHSYLELEYCVASGNATGVQSNGGSFFAVSNSTISHNAVGISLGSGGVIVSRMSNGVTQNGSNGTFTFTVPGS